jgi:UDP-glucose:(heptosyl)LPS alpha-1,3-glucosyltransferase
MRILLIARPFVFHGGVERATAGLIGALVEHGYDVHLLTFGEQAPVRGVTVRRLPLPTRVSAARALLLVAGARRVVSRGGWDVVPSHERTLDQDIYRAGEGCHRAYLASRQRAEPRGLYHRLILSLERRVFARTPRIVAIARLGKQEIETLYAVNPARVSVVYNGVDLQRFHPRHRATLGVDARRELDLASDAWVILFVGSGFERKGLATALTAFAALDDPGSRLLVVGKGDLRAYRAQAEQLGVGARVAWLGPRPDVERWYAAADACVLPARYEPFGNVHLEALASGVPMLTSRAAGGGEVVLEGVSGALVEPGQPAQLVQALGDFRPRSPQHRAELAAAARRSAEPYTYAAQVAGFAALYRGGAGFRAKMS